MTMNGSGFSMSVDMNVALLLSMALKESLANDECPLLAAFSLVVHRRNASLMGSSLC